MDNKVKIWLQSVLTKKDVIDFDFKITGNSAKGEGYLSDILFVEVNAQGQQSNQVTYNLVLKCSKTDATFRKEAPITESFNLERIIYETIIPEFTTFQESRGVKNIFDSIPKYFGSYFDSNQEVLILENLKSCGYDLWDKRLPLPRKHLELILREYGKWHAISAAMQDQVPEKFNEITAGLTDVWSKFAVLVDFKNTFVKFIKDTFILFEKDFTKEMMDEWKLIIDQVPDIVDSFRKPGDHLSVLCHSDCWNNNFLFKSKNNPEKVAIIDWQIVGILSPVIDLSYFIYNCCSGEDLEDFDQLLKIYHTSFSDHLNQMGSDPDKIYPLEQLHEDWLKFGKFGVVWAVFGVKAALTEQEDTPDFAETVNTGTSILDAFRDSKFQSGYKERIQNIIEHALKRGIIRHSLY